MTGWKEPVRHFFCDACKKNKKKGQTGCIIQRIEEIAEQGRDLG